MTHDSIAPAVFHLIARFVAGEFFVKSDVERNGYLSLLGDALGATDWKCIAYAIMSSHVHLAVVAGEGIRSTWLRNAHAPFGAWINQRRERFGAVFANSVKTLPVEPHDVPRVVAYVHNNPVRANVVSRAVDSDWTSHRAYLGLGRAPRWLDVELGMALMKMDGRDAFARFVDREAVRPADARRRRGRPAIGAQIGPQLVR